jgi:competence protein ComEC
MRSTECYVLCLAYIAGLLCAGIAESIYGISLGAIALLLSSMTSAVLIPRLWRTAPKARFWLLTGCISLMAFGHLHLRTPSPSLSDLSLWQQRINPDAIVTVYGQILDEPQLNRNQRVRFLLRAERATVQPSADASQTVTVADTVTGKVYTTVSLLQGTGHYPGEWVQVRGTLYLPNAAQNPGGFDFRAYLAQEGVFSGLQGDLLVHVSDDSSVLWRIRHFLWGMRQRVVRGLVRRLKTPEGTLLSAMVLGRRAVDLPYDVRDAFTQAGLAHTIAASGFHVSLLLSVVMILARRTSPQTQCWIGSGVLLLYVGLTGAQASVLRAGLMGFAALLGGAMERRSKPVPMLLLIATLLLIWNPLWVFDLGFQFSFLATLGLLVLVPALIAYLDWMPTGIATLAAVPIAAYLWVMPIQMQVFGSIPTYSILLNILTTPLILLVSLGGMVSGAIALILPSVGGVLAWCLHLPIACLLWLVKLWNQLPGNTLITGRLGVVQVILIYGVYGLVWWNPRWQKRWWLAMLSILAVITAPMAYAQLHAQTITVLATSHGPALVVRDRGTVGLIFSGTDADATYTVMPFLRSHGIGRLHWAIAPHLSTDDDGWPRIVETIPIQSLHYSTTPQLTAEQTQSSNSATLVTASSALPPVETPAQLPAWISASSTHTSFQPGQQIREGRIPIQWLSSNPAMFRFQLGNRRWLVSDRHDPTSLPPPYEPGMADIVWWSGEDIDTPWIEQLSPTVAIAPTLANGIRTHRVSPDDPDTLNTPIIQVYQTEQTGALQWSPGKGLTQLITPEQDEFREPY